MGLQFMDGWPRVVVTAVGLVLLVYLIATKQLPVQRRRYRSPWEVPVDEPSAPSARTTVEPSLPVTPLGERPFRRVPRTRTEAVLKFVVFSAAVATVVGLLWAMFAFFTNLPGWS